MSGPVDLDSYPRTIEAGHVRLVIWHAVDTDGTRTWHWAAHFGRQHMGIGETRSPESAEAAALECAATVVGATYGRLVRLAGPRDDER